MEGGQAPGRRGGVRAVRMWRVMLSAVLAVVFILVVLSIAMRQPQSVHHLGAGQFSLGSSGPQIPSPIFVNNSTVQIIYPSGTFGSYPSFSHILSVDSYSNVIDYGFTARWNVTSNSPFEFDDMYTFLSTNIHTWNGEEIGVTDDMRGGNGYGIIKAYIQPSNNTGEMVRTLFSNDRKSHDFRIALNNFTADFYVDGKLTASISGLQNLTNDSYSVVVGANRWSDNFSSAGDVLTVSNMSVTER